MPHKNINFGLRGLFPCTLFLSAVLLFSIQPMVAKTLLPIYGGTPMVWTICMLFFQTILLLAYGYTYLLNRTIQINRWRRFHSFLLLLSTLALPLFFHPKTGQNLPEWDILRSLLTEIGLPLFVIAATAPLLQLAYSRSHAKDAADPYFLYIASNLGSLLALLAYPWLIERYIGLQKQWLVWNVGFGLYALLLLFLLNAVAYTPGIKTLKKTNSWSWKKQGYWVFLSFVPCSLMLSVTLYITTDVAATPLFWVLPFALYLLTFILTFTTKTRAVQAFVQRNALVVLAFPILSFIMQAAAWQMVLFHLCGFFILALLCHGSLFQQRPEATQLPLFYFCLALGGVLAGMFNGLFAPHVFNQVYEYPISLILAMLVLPTTAKPAHPLTLLLVLATLLMVYFLPEGFSISGLDAFQLAGIIALTIILISRHSKGSLFFSFTLLFAFLFVPSLQKAKPLLQQRSFYAVNKVVEKQGIHAFLSQSTLHGLQVTQPKSAALNGFTSYYAAVKPLVHFLKKQNPSLNSTIIGLGTGTMLCQFRDSDRLSAIEIDKQVIEIASNPTLFTYVRDCPPKVHIINQDGRLAVNNLPDHSQDLIVLDAFNSDAIPIHLLTKEAFMLYKNKIKPQGVLLVNISNRHLKLLPLMNALAQNLDLISLQIFYKGDTAKAELSAQWVILTSNEALAFYLLENKGWQLIDKAGWVLWTDDYSNILPLMWT